jgi:hypothetical protein
MTEPLSITTSVVGITVPALHGVRLLSEDLQQLKEAPETVKRLSEDVQSVETSLKLLQSVGERMGSYCGECSEAKDHVEQLSKKKVYCCAVVVFCCSVV